MKATLLLNDEPETVRLMLKEITSGGVVVRESEWRAGCNCDRWGHPWGVCRAQYPTESGGSDFITSQSAR